MDELYRGWADGRVVGWALRVGGKPKTGNTIHKETNSTETATVNLAGPDSHQQWFDTPSRLISVHQWPHRPCSGPSWFCRVSKRPPVKADLAIYSLVVGMSGLWMNVATILNKNTLGVKKCEANQKQHISRQVLPKAIISAEAKKLATLSKNF